MVGSGVGLLCGPSIFETSALGWFRSFASGKLVAEVVYFEMCVLRNPFTYEMGVCRENDAEMWFLAFGWFGWFGFGLI